MKRSRIKRHRLVFFGFRLRGRNFSGFGLLFARFRFEINFRSSLPYLSGAVRRGMSGHFRCGDMHGSKPVCLVSVGTYERATQIQSSLATLSRIGATISGINWQVGFAFQFGYHDNHASFASSSWPGRGPELV